MKRFFYILLIFSASEILYSCSPERIIFEGPYHVRFTEDSKVIRESEPGIVEISVHLVGPQVEERVDIFYTVSGTAREGRDYEFVSEKGKIIIPRGESFGTIQLRMINNSNNILESQDVVLTLNSVDPSSYEIGRGTGVRIGQEHILTIQDDCILGGQYTSVGIGRPVLYEEIRISSSDCIEYRLSNWDISVFDFPTERDLIFRDNGDNTLQIESQEDDTLPSDLATIRGDGFVNPITREITLNIELVDFEDSPIVTLVFTPK